MHATQNRVRMDALARRHGGNPGGCTPLPSGWSALNVVVSFPSSYGGYAGSVNTAELVPANEDAGSYAKGGPQPPGTMVRPAWRAGSGAVQTSMCAPAGGQYWLLVDSGMARVLIGKLTVGTAPGPYNLRGNAPPLRR